MRPKTCKWCNSIWHSKNKCRLAPQKPSKLPEITKRPKVPVDSQNVSERLRLAHKGISERSQLIGWADKVFSEHIRNRGADGVTNICYTCKDVVPIDEIQDGHFMSRRYMNTRWDVINNNPQCPTCNIERHGNLKVYEQRLRQDYGDEAIDELKLLAYSIDKFTLEDIKNIIKMYEKPIVF